AIPNLRSSAGVCFALATRTVVRGAQFSPPDGFARRAALATVSESLNSRVHRTESGAICRLADRQMRERDQSGILAHGTNRTSLDCYVTERSTSEGFLNSTGFRIHTVSIILVVDDHGVYRAGLRGVLEARF